MRPSAFAVSSLLLTACGAKPDPTQFDPRDVSGNYQLTYDDRLTARLDVAGLVREVTHAGYGGVVDFGVVNGSPVTLDLTAFCGRPEVQCPSESFWAKVAITQPHRLENGLDLQQLTVVDDTVHSLDAGVRAASLSGLVDHANDDRFLLGLGANAGANQACLALAFSLAGGRFSRVGERTETTLEGRTERNRSCPLDGGFDGGVRLDAGMLPDGGAADGGVVFTCAPTTITRLVAPPNAPVAGLEDGTVLVGFAGGCAFGPVLAGASLTLTTGFSGTRTGAFDPPPFTPAPVVLPDGGADGGP